MSRKYLILAKAFDKRSRLLSTATNSYTKTSPLMKYFGEKVGLPEKQYWHAEALALVRCKDKQAYKLTVERYDLAGEQRLAMPCLVCREIIAAYGVVVVEYTSDNGWIKEKV